MYRAVEDTNIESIFRECVPSVFSSNVINTPKTSYSRMSNRKILFFRRIDTLNASVQIGEVISVKFAEKSIMTSSK